MGKDLKQKAIKIKGKDYVQVKDRILYFNDTYENGAIQTELLANDEVVTFKAVVIPDTGKPERYFTGYSQDKWGDGMVNTTSALENAETSAVGRALAMMGIGVLDSIASGDEMTKAQNRQAQEDMRPWLNQPTLGKAKKAMDEGNYTLEQIKKKYRISKDNLAYLEGKGEAVDRVL